MIVSIQLFASLKDAARTSRLEVEAPDGATIAQVLALVGAQFPVLEKWLPHCRVAVGEEYATGEQTVRTGDDVALIPPVSGGADEAREPLADVVERELSLDEVTRAVRAQKGGAAGAICTFLGVVRETSRDLQGRAHDDIEFLDYEAYAPMARREMRAIALEASQKWDASCAVMHRVGRLGIGEASVVIAVATAHRAASFEACRYIIEELKVRVPVWKRENARDGFWWSEGSAAKTEENQ